MNPSIYYVLHVGSIILLTAYTFSAFANPNPERKKGIMMATGILSLIALVAGFGLLSVNHHGFPGWVIVKFVCWLALSSFSGLCFRLRDKIPLFQILTILAILLALIMVYFRPF